MENQEYETMVKKYLHDYEIKSEEETHGLVRVDIVPRKRGWGIVTFVFAEHNIACFGDIESFVWNTTWNAAEEIKHGNCHAKQFGYLFQKLEHREALEILDINDKTLSNAMEEAMEGMSQEQAKEFEEKWKANLYRLVGMDIHHLEGWDDFCDELGIDREAINCLFEMPNHYYSAVAMLRCIEDYFTKKEKKE